MPSISEESASWADIEAALAPIDVAGIHRSTRDSILPKYPPGIRNHLVSRYQETANHRPAGIPGWSREPWMQADLGLLHEDQALRTGRFRVAFDADELRLKAESCADAASALMRNADPVVGYKAAAQYATDQGIEPAEPSEPYRSLDGCRRRLTSARWWRPRLKKIAYQSAEAVERDLGLVQASRGIYASDDAVNRRIEERARARALLAACVAVNDLGECITLEDIADSTVSNPRIRRAEFMTRLRGCEEYASRHDHEAVFITLTAPSRFHAFRRDGQRNPKSDSSTPTQAQDWLCRIWARIRANLDRHGVNIYGFRIAEPHHDGTPHWHLLLFFEGKQSNVLRQTFERYMLAEAGDEPGARQHRVRFEAIDQSKGSATGYLAKYVSKNIDGRADDVDLEDSVNARSTQDTAVRAEAWASLWHVRQFQQIGGPPVTVWREFRRLSAPLAGLAEMARAAADQGNWCGYMEAMGGHTASQRSRCIRILRVWREEPGLYGDPIGFQISGVDCGGESVITRFRRWAIIVTSRSLDSRTCVNNCTSTTTCTTAIRTDSIDRNSCASSLLTRSRSRFSHRFT